MVERWSAKVAEVHRLFDDPNQTDRLRRILSDRLLQQDAAKLAVLGGRKIVSKSHFELTIDKASDELEESNTQAAMRPARYAILLGIDDFNTSPREHLRHFVDC